jgi:hypothetical protein
MVRRAGYGEMMEVECGMMEFLYQDSSTPQSRLSELMLLPLPRRCPRVAPHHGAPCRATVRGHVAHATRVRAL